MLALRFITEIWSPLGWVTKKAGKLSVKAKSWRLCTKILSWYHWYSNVMAWSSLVPWSDLTKISQLKTKTKTETKSLSQRPKEHSKFSQSWLTQSYNLRGSLSTIGRDAAYAQTGGDDGPSREQGSGRTARGWAGASRWEGASVHCAPGPLRCRAPDSPPPVLATLPLVCSHSVFPPFTFFLNLFYQARKPADL